MLWSAVPAGAAIALPALTCSSSARIFILLDELFALILQLLALRLQKTPQLVDFSFQTGRVASGYHRDTRFGGAAISARPCHDDHG
jgi:hypothetical protein